MASNNLSSSQRNPESEPLLSSTSSQDLQHQLSTSDSVGTGLQGMAQAVKKANKEDRTAWIAQALVFAFAALIWSLIFSKMDWRSLPLFGYHPILQSLSLILLVQSLVTLQPTTAQDPSRKKAALNLHQIVNLVLLLPILTIGASIMWYLHDQPGAQHWISWHGILGAVALAWAYVQALIGGLSVWFKGSLLGGENRAKRLWKWHRLSGYLLLVLFFVVYFLGATKTAWTIQNASNPHHVIVSGVLLGLLVTLLFRVQTSKLPQLL